MVNYPAQIDNILSLPPAADGTTAVSASVVNRLREAILAVQTELGVKPSGSYTNVKGRLDVVETTVGSLQVISLAGDLGGTYSAPKVIGLQGRPVSPNAPSTGEAFIWNGSVWAASSNIYSDSITSAVIQGSSIYTPLLALDGKLIFTGIDPPGASVSNTGEAILYFDLSEGKIKFSENGGAYSYLSPFFAGGDLSGDNTSQVVEKINGATVPAAGSLTTNHVLKVSGASALSYGLIVNDNVDASAAIAGSKVNPDFGSQNIVTLGSITGDSIVSTTSVTGDSLISTTYVATGATPASVGAVRLTNNESLASRNATDSANFDLLKAGNDNWMYLGSAGLAGSVFSGGSGPIYFEAVSAVYQINDWDASPQEYRTRFAASWNHRIKMDDNTTASAIGKKLTIQGQDATGTTAIGGDLVITSGTGTSMAGSTRVQTGGNTMLEATEVSAGQRVLALARMNTLNSTQMPANTGDGVVYVGDAATVPTANPASGAILYSEDGALKARDADGVVSSVLGDPTINGLRLTLTTATPITTSDVTSSTVYLTPYVSGYISLWDGASWVLRNTEEISIALSGLTSNTNYDIFAYWTGSAVQLELSAAWTNDTSRSEALTRQNGILVKSGSLTRRYLGTIRTISTTQTVDSKTQRLIWNYYHRVQRQFEVVTGGGSSWNYSSTTWRYAGTGSATVGTNIAAVVCGDTSDIAANVHGLTLCTTNSHMEVGVGLDSTTPVSRGGGLVIANIYGYTSASWHGLLSLGYHFVAWLEHGENATGTWYGASSVRQVGMQGFVLG